ncbi:MAG TPA: limonene-1,2-epoxide hydrolase [Gammaproteobacteria bacterium]|nr:limonene-1,2-epoxide hydrolase [Gammaproteobacteria bacterium]
MKRITLLACVLLTLAVTTVQAQTESNEAIVRDFISAWQRLNPSELAGYFSEDGVYHNMPSAAVVGRDNIEQFIAGFISQWESTDWEVINLLANGDRVMVERLDKTVVAGSPVNLPCFGYFELSDGKIKLWRDYFDLATYTTALTAALAN